MEDWKEVSLQDCCDELSDGLHKAPKFVFDGEFIFVNAKNLSNGRIIDNDKSKHTTFEEFQKYKIDLNNRTLLYSIDGTIGNLARYNNEKCVLGKGACYLKIKEGISVDFIYYQLQSSHFKKYINFYTTGSTIGHISLKTMRNYCFSIPPLPTQRKIAQILSSLDDKIELNNKINANLEQQAQALFKSWFVDFEPFGGEMPAGWKEGKLSEIAEITSGKRPPMKQLDLSKDVQIPLLGAASVMGYTNSVLYNEPILVTGRVGTHGIIQRFNSECWPSDNTLVVKSHYYEYTYQIMCNIDYSNMNRGSTQPLITQSDLGKVECLIPAGNELEKFEKLVNILFNKIDANMEENKKLSNLRDTLLPKLMNGEIEVYKRR